MSTALSVNLNKIAVLRNSRGGSEPDVQRAGITCLDAGAHGLTVHPRPDARHIRQDDVHVLGAMCRDRGVEFNVEGNPFAPPRPGYRGRFADLKNAINDTVDRLSATVSSAARSSPAPAPQPADELARWRPSWLRYSPLSLSGLLAVGAGVGMAYQAGYGDLVSDWVVVLLIASVPLTVGRSLLTYGNLVLTRGADTVGLVHGLVRVRQYTYDLRRLRGGTLSRLQVLCASMSRHDRREVG